MGGRRPGPTSAANHDPNASQRSELCSRTTDGGLDRSLFLLTERHNRVPFTVDSRRPVGPDFVPPPVVIVGFFLPVLRRQDNRSPYTAEGWLERTSSRLRDLSGSSSSLGDETTALHSRRPSGTDFGPPPIFFGRFFLLIRRRDNHLPCTVNGRLDLTSSSLCECFCLRSSFFLDDKTTTYPVQSTAGWTRLRPASCNLHGFFPILLDDETTTCRLQSSDQRPS